MGITSISDLIVLPILMILNGAIAYYLWRVLKKNLAKRKSLLSVFNVIVVFPPMIAFGFGFFFFLVETIKSIFDAVN